MKIRTDYVSNSSSSSFIVRDSNAVKMFYDDFKESMKEYEPMGETMSVIIQTKEHAKSYDDMYYDDFAKSIEDGSLKFEDVEYIYFDCDDWDATGMMYLNFLYKYFEKFGFHPDDSDSERDFRSRVNDTFLGRILDRLQPKNESTAN